MERDQAFTSPSPHQNPFQPVLEVLQGSDPGLVCTKYGITRAELEQQFKDFQALQRQRALEDELITKKVGRNEPCPCGSGKKYKKCCLPKHEEARKHLSPDQLQEKEELAKLGEKLDKDAQKGFDYIYSQDFGKARRLAERMLESYPEDDRFHDILVTAWMTTGDYDQAFHHCRRRWQIAQEEKEFFQENGYHKRAGIEQKQPVHFYSPSTWLEKFWIAQRARTYRNEFPPDNDSPLKELAEKLKVANDTRRFPGRQGEGYEMRRKALAPVLDQLKAEGPAMIPYLLPLTYSFSWASIFVPGLLHAYGNDTSIRLLAELSMFRLPYFAQECLTHLEELGERAIPYIKKTLEENRAFDELKVGLILVLGSIPTPESFAILTKLTEHESPYIVNWVAQALGRHQNPQALPYLEKSRERLGAHSKIAGAIRELVGLKGKSAT